MGVVTPGKHLTREGIISVYKEMLRRPPESEATINLHLAAHSTVESFRASLLLAPEYLALSTPYPGRKVLLADLDKEMQRIERVAQSATFDLLKEANSFWVEISAIQASPRSVEYADWVMKTYHAIARQPYALKNEASTFVTDELVGVPFPYATKNAHTVGEQLMAIGHVIQSMDLPVGASILELGFGWGNTSLHLSRMGYAVTGIDIEQKFVDLVRSQAAMLQTELDVRQGTFFEIEELQQTFDAVLFFEFFHHCSDHIRLLKAIPRVLKPGGKLVLAGEAINNRLPYPWGINPGGQAVYCIREFGWLELCFREDYLLELLEELGWNFVKHDFPQSATGITYVATRETADHP